MRNASIRFLGVLLVGLLLGGSTARADFIGWSYNWGIGPAPVLASGTGTVAEALYRGASEQGSHTILAAAMTTSSSATVQYPDVFNKHVDVTLHLTDAQSHKSADLTFHETIAGTLSQHSSHLFETVPSPYQHVTLGNHTYYVSLASGIMLLAPGAGVNNLSAYVYVQNAVVPHLGFQPSIASIQTDAIRPAPEPSSFALAGVGVVLLGFIGFRNRRRLSVAAA